MKQKQEKNKRKKNTLRQTQLKATQQVEQKGETKGAGKKLKRDVSWQHSRKTRKEGRIHTS
jgi:hypothetical protein